jgi:hypothetical protein
LLVNFKEKEMFLHIKAFTNQISLHSMEEVTADVENDVEAKSAEPLRNVIDSALKYWNRKEKDLVVFNETRSRKLDLNKSAKDNGLSDNDLVIVTSQTILDEEEAARIEEEKAIEKARIEAKKNTAKLKKEEEERIKKEKANVPKASSKRGKSNSNSPES